jgi:Transposase and inactivated derivatives, IS5 family
MSQQLTFADSEFSSKRRQTRKELFLSRMDNLLPWPQLLEVIDPFYPKAGNGRRPYALETMFRIHCMQQWYSLGDEAMEDALYEIASMRQFAQLSLDKAIPDRTTIMNFRHLLEKAQADSQIIQNGQPMAVGRGVMMTQGHWWMPRLLKRQVLLKIKRMSVTRRCIRPRKAMNGTLV